VSVLFWAKCLADGRQAWKTTKPFRLPVFAALIYGLTVYCAITATVRRSPLGLVSASHGVFILHLLAKAGDISLAYALSSSLEGLMWFVVARAKGMRLSTFLAFSGSTNVFGLAMMILSRSSGGERSSRARRTALVR
jgi:hypothetical protein